MGELNFSSNNPSNNNNDQKPEPVSFRDTKDLSQDKERIEKSRKEVLEMIDKNKGGSNSQTTGGNKAKSGKSWLSSVFGGSGKDQKGTKADPGSANQDSVPEHIVPAPASQPEEDEGLEKEMEHIDSGKGFSGKNTQEYKKPLKDNPFMFKDRSWKSADVLETNLIDRSELGFFDAQRKYKYFINSVLAAILVLCISYLGILYWENLELDKLLDRKYKINRMADNIRIKEKEMEPARIFQEKLDTSKTLLDKHVYWTNFFKFLEENTMKNIYFANGFAGSIDGVYDFTIRADSYENIKNQLKVFAENEMVLDLEAESPSFFEEVVGEKLVMGEEGEPETVEVASRGYETTVTIELDKELFYRSYENDNE